jgi:G3E family GTPase
MHREALAWAPEKKHLPVTLVTGFLGSGKTTLLTHVLTNKHNLKIAAAVNDFASLNIDGQIVKGTGHQDGVVELSNGCLCCSISGEFKKAVWQLLQDADIGKIDYLIVETSGITDPLQTIATLEQDYGKMYRVRLDVVVTVIDTDALVTKLNLGENYFTSVAADSQLQCADVVLLNKKDLVSEDGLQMAKKFVESQVPGVAVYSCRGCAVPLNWIMEVSEVVSNSHVVSHEVTEAAYTISSTGGFKNTARHGREVGGTNSSVKSSDHLSNDEYQSLVYESSVPFALDKFQHFLGEGFPPGLVRMKGSVWFQENRSCLYSFHMSGRNRYELTPSISRGGSLQIHGAFKVELVAIGRNINTSDINDALNVCLYKESTASFTQDRLREVNDLINSHDYFVLEANDGDNSYVDFRVTGCIDYGVTEEEASGFHGINFSRMNEDIAARVNGSCIKGSLLPVLLPNGKQVCRHAVSVQAGLENTWSVITNVAERVVTEYYRAVGVCKCGR